MILSSKYRVILLDEYLEVRWYQGSIISLSAIPSRLRSFWFSELVRLSSYASRYSTTATTATTAAAAAATATATDYTASGRSATAQIAVTERLLQHSHSGRKLYALLANYWKKSSSQWEKSDMLGSDDNSEYFESTINNDVRNLLSYNFLLSSLSLTFD